MVNTKRYKLYGVIVLAVVVVVAGALAYLQSPSADVNPNNLGTPQYPVGGANGAAINGVVVNNRSTDIEYGNGYLEYQNELASAAVAVYADETSAPVYQTTTDSKGEYFLNMASGQYIICAFKTVAPPTLQELNSYGGGRDKCSDNNSGTKTTVVKHEDNYIDLAAADYNPPEVGVIHVDAKDQTPAANPLNGVFVSITCADGTYLDGILPTPIYEGSNLINGQGDFVVNPRQNCDVTTTFQGQTQGPRTVNVPVYQPNKTKANVNVTFDTRTPLVWNFLKSLVTPEKAHAAPAVKKKIIRNTTKTNGSKPKEVSQGFLAGVVKDQNGNFIPNFTFTATLDRDIYDNVTGVPSRYYVPIQTDSQGRFVKTPVKFIVNENNPFSFASTDPNAPITSVSYHGSALADGKVLLSKTSRSRSASGALIVTPYKANGIEIKIQRDSFRLSGESQPAQTYTPAINSKATFQIWTEQNQQASLQAFNTTTTFDYVKTPHPQKNIPYIVQVTPQDTNTEISGIYKKKGDGTLEQLAYHAAGTGASRAVQVTLTDTEKSIHLVAKIQKKVNLQFSGSTLSGQASPVLNGGEMMGTYTILNAQDQVVKTVQNTRTITLKTQEDAPHPMSDQTYKVVFAPAQSDVSVKEYIELPSQTNLGLSPTFVLNEQTPSKVIVAKLVKASTTLSVTVPALEAPHTDPIVVFDTDKAPDTGGNSKFKIESGLQNILKKGLAKISKTNVKLYTRYSLKDFTVKIDGTDTTRKTDLQNHVVNVTAPQEAHTVALEGTNKFTEKICLVKQGRKGIKKGFKKYTDYRQLTIKQPNNRRIGQGAEARTISFETSLTKQVMVTKGINNPVAITLEELGQGTNLVGKGKIREEDIDESPTLISQDDWDIDMEKVKECLNRIN